MNEKYKLLLIGANKTLIYDFFVQMDRSFEMLSCSRQLDDIWNHLKYYHPDAIVICLYNESREDFTRAGRIKELLRDMDTVMIAVGDRAKCDAFERAVPTAADYVIHRAKGDNSKVVGEQIIKYLDSRARSKKKKEESEQQKKETSATPAASSIDELLAAAAEAVNELRDMPKKTPGVRHHVLVVDDDSSMLRMIKEILCTEYDVATAINGKVALKFLENRKTDIILLDYEMPVQSGAEVYGKLLENPATKDIPVVFLTGVSDRDRIAEVLAMRPRGYLLKPIDSDRLKKTIEEIVG